MSGLRLVLAVVSIGTALLATWLTYVLIAVVPTRSPASMPAWVAIDILAIGLLAAGVAWLVRPGSLLARATRAIGIAASFVGVWLASTYIGAPGGADIDGYVLLIGGWLIVHGVLVVLATRGDLPSRPERGGPAGPVAYVEEP